MFRASITIQTPSNRGQCLANPIQQRTGAGHAIVMINLILVLKIAKQGGPGGGLMRTFWAWRVVGDSRAGFSRLACCARICQRGRSNVNNYFINYSHIFFKSAMAVNMNPCLNRIRLFPFTALLKKGLPFILPRFLGQMTRKAEFFASFFMIPMRNAATMNCYSYRRITYRRLSDIRTGGSCIESLQVLQIPGVDSLSNKFSQ